MGLYHIYFADQGTPKTGLTPSFSTLAKRSDGTDITPPAISEIKGGHYKFTLTPTEVLVGVIDGGSALTNAADRYVPCTFTPNDEFIDAAMSSRASQSSVDAIDSVADATALAVADVKAKTDSLPDDPASETTVSSRASQSSVDAIDSVADAIALAVAGIAQIVADKTGYALSAEAIAAIDEYVGDIHGKGPWGAAAQVIIPTIPGRVLNASPLQNEEVVIKRGDSLAIPIDLGADYPSFDIQWGGRRRNDKTAYAIEPRVWRKVDDRHGYLDLTSDDTATVGVIDMEVEAKLDTAVHTTNTFTLRIVDDELKTRAT